MLGALQRLLLPGIQHLDVSGPCCSTSSGSQQQWQAAGTPQQHCQQQYATRTTTPQAEAAGNNPPVQPHPQVSQLTAQQKQELKQAVIDSFNKDSRAASKLLAKSLSDDARRQLLSALEASQEPPGLSRTAMVDAPDNNHTAAAASTAEAASAGQSTAAEEVQEPTFKQLLRVAVVKGIPFVAFGFFDNIIMITAGEQIDLMFGAKLGLSSMAAAGLGNTVADVVGINISHTIERKFKGMQSMAPALTKAQLALPRTQRAKWLGCAIGMASGCLLGLTPLLFYDVNTGHGDGCAHGGSSSGDGGDVHAKQAGASA